MLIVCQDLCFTLWRRQGRLTHIDRGIIQVANAIDPVESGALGLADGRHDLLLIAHPIPDDVGDQVPPDHRRADHLWDGKKQSSGYGGLQAVCPSRGAWEIGIH